MQYSNTYFNQKTKDNTQGWTKPVQISNFRKNSSIIIKNLFSIEQENEKMELNDPKPKNFYKNPITKSLSSRYDSLSPSTKSLNDKALYSEKCKDGTIVNQTSFDNDFLDNSQKMKILSDSNPSVVNFNKMKTLEFKTPKIEFNKFPFPPIGPDYSIRILNYVHSDILVQPKKYQLDHEILSLSCGLHYKGSFRFGKMNGKGKLILSKFLEVHESLNDNSKDILYEGDFENGYVSGKGTLRFMGGEYFEGSFKEGIAHGFGKYFDRNGVMIVQGSWIHGKYIK